MIIWFSSSSINTKRNSEVCATFFSCVWFFVYIFLYFSYILKHFCIFCPIFLIQAMGGLNFIERPTWILQELLLPDFSYFLSFSRQFSFSFDKENTEKLGFWSIDRNDFLPKAFDTTDHESLLKKCLLLNFPIIQ